MTNHIVLYAPEIPPNTGNIARTCAGTDTVLDLIEPLGFSIDDKHLKRAGLDYWHDVNIHLHKSLDDFMTSMSEGSELYLISKFANRIYTEVDYSDVQKDYYLLFGKETTGLPKPFLKEHEEECVRLPMDDTHIRSLNLSNTAAIMIYEVLRQQDFIGLDLTHHYENDKIDNP